MNINNLVIETTRRCNMECEHCLRGKQEDEDMEWQAIFELSEQVDYISTVVFSGGEPSLNVGVINYFLEVIKRRNVEIGSFYIATNGLDIDEQFIITCLRLYAYCDEKDMCSVEVSNDYFHQVWGSYDTELLEGLGFFRRKYSQEGHYYDGNSAINQGRYAELYSNGRELKELPIVTRDDFDEAEIYLNTKGQVINGCNWSYKEQGEHVLCRVEGLTDYYNSLEVEDE